MSLPKAGVARGGAIGDTAPGRGLDVGVEGRGPTVARGIGATALAGFCAWSSGVWMGRLPCGLPPGGSRGGGTGRGDEPGSQVSKNSHLSHIFSFCQQKHRKSHTDVSYLTSCWGRRCRPRGGGGGAGADGKAGGSWMVAVNRPGALWGWRYPGSFHRRHQGEHQTRCCLHLGLPCWAHTTRRSPPHGSSDTQLVRSEL